MNLTFLRFRHKKFDFVRKFPAERLRVRSRSQALGMRFITKVGMREISYWEPSQTEGRLYTTQPSVPNKACCDYRFSPIGNAYHSSTKKLQSRSSPKKKAISLSIIRFFLFLNNVK
jgi:hypothetical protein